MTFEQQIERFIEKYPDCPDPEHHPQVVKYLWKLFQYDLKIKKIK